MLSDDCVSRDHALTDTRAGSPGWTEFKLVTVLGVRELLLRDADAGVALARKYYPTLQTLSLAPSYFAEDEGLLVKGDPSWESGGKDPATNKHFQCWDPADACASCEPDLIDYPPKYGPLL